MSTTLALSTPAATPAQASAVAATALAGRVLLALMFILAGISKFGGLEGTAGYISSKGLPLASVLAVLVAALEVVAGVMLVVGFKARWAAGALALFTVVASVIFHAFWAMPAEQQFVQQLMFMKNLAVTGGLLMIVALGAGPLAFDTRSAR